MSNSKSIVMISDQVMQSDAMRSLTSNQRYLYVTLLLMANKQENPYQNKSKYDEETQMKITEDCFYASCKDISMYYMPNYTGNSGRFSKDMKALVKVGLIEVVMSGQHTKQKSIYKYSSKWKSYKIDTSESQCCKEDK